MEKKEIHGVTMIPFGLLAGFADEKEIRITELAEDGFRFRTAEDIGNIDRFRLCFYEELCKKTDPAEPCAKKSPYREIELLNFEMKLAADEMFGVPICQYLVFVEDESYRECVRSLLLSYDGYIQLKLSCEDAELAEALTVYPAEEDEVFALSLEEEKKEWFLKVKDTQQTETKESSLEYAIELDRTELYETYQKMELAAFLDWYWEESHAKTPGKLVQKVSRIYVGNAFCHQLFPTQKQLFEILEKADREGLAVTITFSYLREFMLEPVEKLLEDLESWCKAKEKAVEIAANDWGMLELLKGRKEFLIPCLGILLNKRKKDPRMKYKKGDVDLLKENSLNAAWYRKYLRDTFGIRRYEWESCGYGQQLPDGNNSLHVPFYQTNTSQYCTLYAACKNGDRGRQELPEECPRYCGKKAFLYPKHLKMTGRYNSLFALDESALAGLMDPAMWKSEGISRVVIGLL